MAYNFFVHTDLTFGKDAVAALPGILEAEGCAFGVLEAVRWGCLDHFTPGMFWNALGSSPTCGKALVRRGISRYLWSISSTKRLISWHEDEPYWYRVLAYESVSCCSARVTAT